MDEMIAKRIDVDGHAGVLLETPIDPYGAVNANDAQVIGPISNDRVSPFGRRGASCSWLPGAWGDPF